MIRAPLPLTVNADHLEGSDLMNKRFLVTLLAVLGLSAVVAASALAARNVAFTAKYSGQTSTAVAKGSGTGNLVGKSTLGGTVIASLSDSPCAPFTGPGAITGP